MSNVSIFETRWIELVFEGKNKEYGAYQLRQENPKTTIKALFLGLLLISALVSIPLLNGLINKSQPIVGAVPTGPITLVDLSPQPTKPPAKKDVATPLTKSDKPKTKIDKKELSNPTDTDKQKKTLD